MSGSYKGLSRTLALQRDSTWSLQFGHVPGKFGAAREQVFNLPRIEYKVDAGKLRRVLKTTLKCFDFQIMNLSSFFVFNYLLSIPVADLGST